MSTITTNNLAGGPVVGDPIGFPPPVSNTVLTDLQNAFDTYPETYLSLEIYDVNLDAASGDVLNEGDKGTFKIRVTNTGPLPVDQLTVKIEGLNGMKVAFHDAGGNPAFESSITSSPFALIFAHGNNSPLDSADGHYHFQAGAPTAPDSELIEVSVDDWETDLEHLFNKHTNAAASVKDVYTDEVAAT